MIAQAAPVSGTFTHGPWQGRCYRAGDMAGFDREICRATMSGPTAVEFERDAANIVFRIHADKCEPITLNVDPPPAGLAPDKYARSLVVMLRLMIKSSQKECKAETPRFDVAALGAMIAETNGLAARN